MKKTILSSLLAIAAAAPIVSQAADGTITFNGNITSRTCTINGGTPDFTVNMPTVSASALASAGKTAGVVADSIKINLTACTKTSATPAANGAARAFFEAGPTVDTVTRRLMNSTGTGFATNVEVGVINQDGSDVAVGAASGAQNTQFVALSNTGTATLTYGSKYVATGAATAGTVKTTVQYSIEYQ